MRVQQCDVLQMSEQLLDIYVESTVQVVECLIFSIEFSNGLTCFTYLTVPCSQHVFGLSEILGYFGILRSLRMR
jgi:hypothetical protein